MNLFKTVFGFAVVTPLFARAQYLGDIDTFFGNVSSFIGSYLVPLVFAIALLVFIYGMFQYFILGGGDEGKRTQGKALIVWGIIGFVMMVIIWGVVNMLANGIKDGIGQGNSPLKVVPGTPDL